MKPRVTSFAPQFLVDDLERSIAYYRKLGFTFGEPWGGFYAIGYLDGLELHLKEAPKNQAERRHRRDDEHLDAAGGVDGIEGFYEQCVTNGVRSSGRSRPPRRALKTSTLRIPTATSSASAAVQRQAEKPGRTVSTTLIPICLNRDTARDFIIEAKVTLDFARTKDRRVRRARLFLLS